MRRIYKFIIAVLLLSSALILISGCTYTEPWRRMNLASGNHAASGEAVITITAAESKPWARRKFFEQTRKVIADLPNHDGLLGYSFRFEIFGNRAWTMTAWRDEISRDRFSESQVHSAAVGFAEATTERVKFRSVPVDVRSIPMPWRDALELIDSAKPYPQVISKETQPQPD